MLVDQLAVQVNDRRVLNVVYSMTAFAYRWRRASPTVQLYGGPMPSEMKRAASVRGTERQVEQDGGGPVD
jgi:hypothetical protein